MRQGLKRLRRIADRGLGYADILGGDTDRNLVEGGRFRSERALSR
jgi:hypothetical protein